jgi:hypothetical protein
VDADHCIANGDGLTWHGRLDVGWHSSEQQVRPQPANVVAEPLDGSVRSNQEVEYIEAVWPGVSDKPRAWSTDLADDFGRLTRVPAMTGDIRHAI